MEDLKISELLESIHGKEDADLIKDLTQCTHMVDRAKEYGYKNVGIILDRGYFSMGNIRYFDEMNYDFLMMVKNNSTVVADKIKDAHLPLLTKAKYYLPEHDVYGLTKKQKNIKWQNIF